ESLVAEHDRLQRERQGAQFANRGALPVEGRGAPVPRVGEPSSRDWLERPAEHFARVVELAGLDRVESRVEHQRDPGEVLDGAVVQEERDAPPLVLLRRDQAVEPVVAQSMIASRRAIATACVRVSASSFVRMWRTWLLTVSWEMNSLAATS